MQLSSATSTVDAGAALRASAEQYALHASFVSIPLAALAILLCFRCNRRMSALVAASLCIHPIWTIRETWYDYGSLLKLASHVWFMIGCLSLFYAVRAVRRSELKPWAYPSLRFSIRTFLILVTFMAMAIVLSRPPITDEFPVSKTFPWVGMVLMLTLAIQMPVRSRSKHPQGKRLDLVLKQEAAS